MLIRALVWWCLHSCGVGKAVSLDVCSHAPIDQHGEVHVATVVQGEEGADDDGQGGVVEDVEEGHLHTPHTRACVCRVMSRTIDEAKQSDRLWVDRIRPCEPRIRMDS